jgi:hypothetical protein
MNAFENLAAELFWEEGYWVRNNVRIELTRADKALIGRPSSPRWEIDLIAWHSTRNELLALECKSYHDSGGVHAAHFRPGSKYAFRYKLFHDAVLRTTVLNRLKLQCVERGLCPADATVRLGLVYSHATKHNTPLLDEIFEANNWLLYGPDQLCRHLARKANGSYEDSAATIVTKLLMRPKGPGSMRAHSVLDQTFLDLTHAKELSI